MMLYPSIDRLIEKEKSVYSLIMLASKRARELHDEKDPQMEKYQSVKPIGQALEEVEAGLLYVKRD